MLQQNGDAESSPNAPSRGCDVRPERETPPRRMVCRRDGGSGLSCAGGCCLARRREDVGLTPYAGQPKRTQRASFGFATPVCKKPCNRSGALDA
jgi:hypothetical protein